MLLLAAAGGAVGGCASPGSPAVRAPGAAATQAPDSGPAASAVAGSAPLPPLRPSHPGARVYAARASAEDRASLPADSLRAGIVDDARALARRSGLPPPEGDARLDRAMNDLAANLRGDDLPALEVVDFLLAHYGIAEPSPHLLMARASAGADREIREHTLTEIAQVYKTSPIARIGVGIERAGDAMYVIVGLQEIHLELAAVPRKVAHGAVAPIAGKLETRYHDPQVVITAPNGTVREQATPVRGGAFRGELRCADDGRYQVEVTAVDAMGTAVLANFPVYCGVAPPAVASRSAGVKQGGLNVADAEKQLLDLVNRDRAAAGLRPVALDARLAAVARDHSADMADHDFVGHVSPRTGTALDRLRKAGLTPELVLENVGRAYSADEAESGFMASPGHRGNIVDPRATRVGLGIVFGPAVTGTTPMFVTQLFTN